MIGLIFGETNLPKYIYKKIKFKKKFIIIDLTKKNIFKNYKNSFPAKIGEFGKIISILKRNRCKKVLFAGKVNKPNFSRVRLDFKGLYYFPRILKVLKLGDAAILKEIIKIFEIEKIKTISSNVFTPEISLKKGVYTKQKPNEKDKIDIVNAIKAINDSGDYSFSQGAISRNNKVIAIEKKTGTAAMLKNVKKKKNNFNGVLVKFPKKKQDLRIDLPTVGLETIKQCKKAGLKGLVLKHKKNIFLDKKASIIYANKNKIFILVK